MEKFEHRKIAYSLHNCRNCVKRKRSFKKIEIENRKREDWEGHNNEVKR